MKRKNTKTKSLPIQWTDEFPVDIWHVIVSCIHRDDAGTLLNLLSVSKSFLAVVSRPIVDILTRFYARTLKGDFGTGMEFCIWRIMRSLPLFIGCHFYDKLVLLIINNKSYQTAQYLSEVLSIINLAGYHAEYKSFNDHVMKPVDQFPDTAKLEHVMHFNPTTSEKAVRLYNHPKIKSVKNMPEIKHFDQCRFYQQAKDKANAKYSGFKHDVYSVALCSGSIRERRVVAYTLLRKEVKLIEPREAHRFNTIVVQLDDNKFHHIHSSSAADFMSHCFQFDGKVKRATKMAKFYHAYDRYILSHSLPYNKKKINFS